MANDLIQYGFVGGEISERFFGRTDLEKYDLGLATSLNFFADFRGGNSSRPGTEFVDYVSDSGDHKFIPFQFGTNLANTSMILFGDEYIRFLQDGAYVLEAAKTIASITKASPAVVTTGTAHGFGAGDWIKIYDVEGMTEVNGRTFQVGTVTATTFELLSPVDGSDIDSTDFTTFVSGSAAAIYTLTSPYTSTDLAGLKAQRIRDVVRLTHLDFAPRDLTRTSAANWSLSLTNLKNDLAAPTGLAKVAEGDTSSTTDVVFAVTAVSPEGVESRSAVPYYLDGVSSYSEIADGYVRVGWNAVADAEYYKVYFSTNAFNIDKGVNLGYIGRTYSTEFTQNNIIPDYTQTPPQAKNPFADGAITKVSVTANGTGYGLNDTLSVTDATGTGFAGYPVVNSDGELISIVILSQGKGYTNPTFTINTAAGTGVTLVATISDSSGNFPKISALFQQRQVYADSDNHPLRIWGSKVGQFNNFDVSVSVNDDDAFTFDLDSEEVAGIEHLFTTRGGMLVMSQVGVWLLSNGSGTAVTPVNALAEPQTYNGVSTVPPLRVDNDIIYIEGKGSAIRKLAYNDYSKVYSSDDLSLLSNHLFTFGRRIVDWAYAAEPNKQIIGIRADGVGVSLTYLAGQDVNAWTRYQTRGYYRNVASITEEGVDSVYFIIERKFQGQWVKVIERQASRQFEHVEQAWCVDCGLSTVPETPAATITFSSPTDTATVTASAAVFAAGDVGRVIRAGRGKVKITSYTSSTEVEVEIIRPIPTVPEIDDLAEEFDADDWTLAAEITSISGLWHLEGEAVSILADGNVHNSKVVTNGEVTLDAAASLVIIGLPFTCQMKTLPLTVTDAVIEGRRKRMVGVSLRRYETRGLKIGDTFDSLFEMKDRTTEDYGEPIEAITDVADQLIEAAYEEGGQVCFQQDYPLPATILGIVYHVEVGDDPN